MKGKTILIRTALTMALLICFASCTQNNGHIGKIFGAWTLENITAQGMDEPKYGHDIIWAFQSNVITMRKVVPHYEQVETWGNFRLEDNTLFLDFPDAEFPPFPQGFGPQARFQILKLSAKSMILLYEPEAGKTLTYNFKKW